MNILMITGSPHKKGTSALLADQFCQGAQEQGHCVKRTDAAFMQIHPCTACEYCRSHNGNCIVQDDMDTLMDLIIQADVLVFVTPLYYFGMSAQLKTVIDRLYAKNASLQEIRKQTILLATCADEEAWARDALVLHYQSICKYMNFDNRGILFAHGVYYRKDIEQTDFPKQAYMLGKSIG